MNRRAVWGNLGGLAVARRRVVVPAAPRLPASLFRPPLPPPRFAAPALSREDLERALVLPAGPELDQVVAGAVDMGEDFFSTWYCGDLVDRLNELGLLLRVWQRDAGNWMVRLHTRMLDGSIKLDDPTWYDTAPTLPLALCRAALRALYRRPK